MIRVVPVSFPAVPVHNLIYPKQIRRERDRNGRVTKPVTTGRTSELYS